MPVSTLPSVGFTLTIPNITTLVPVDDVLFGADALAPPDNCHTIVVYNLDAANRVFVRFGMPGTVTAANTTILNSTVVPALGSMTFGVGHVGERAYMDPLGAVHLYFMAETGAVVPINITFLMGRGR
mgnify:CR=1 FL=1|jgi:hypothetical protein